MLCFYCFSCIFYPIIMYLHRCFHPFAVAFYVVKSDFFAPFLIAFTLLLFLLFTSICSVKFYKTLYINLHI